MGCGQEAVPSCVGRWKETGDASGPGMSTKLHVQAVHMLALFVGPHPHGESCRWGLGMME